MNKFLIGALVAGAAVAAGYVISQILKGDNDQPDYDDDIYDYPDPYDTDESIDFEIDDPAVEEALKSADENADEDAAAEAEPLAEDAAEDEE